MAEFEEAVKRFEEAVNSGRAEPPNLRSFLVGGNRQKTNRP